MQNVRDDSSAVDNIIQYELLKLHVNYTTVSTKHLHQLKKTQTMQTTLIGMVSNTRNP